MFPVAYEDVVRRDQPLYWWRPTSESIMPNAVNGGAAATMAPYGSGVNLPYGGPGIPGARQLNGSTHTLGTLTTLGQGWTTGTHTVPFGPTTYEVWAWTDSTPAAGQNLFGRYNQTNSSSGRRAHVLFVDSVAVGIRVDGDSSFNIAVNTGFVVGRWNHIVATLNCRVGTLTNANVVYVNGQPGAAVAGSLNTASGYETLLGMSGINRRTSSGQDSFAGFLAEPAIYGYALSPSQIIDHYHAGLGLRRNTARFASIMAPPAAAPAPGGLTEITTPLVNRRVAVVSDRPR